MGEREVMTVFVILAVVSVALWLIVLRCLQSITTVLLDVIRNTDEITRELDDIRREVEGIRKEEESRA